MVGKVYNHQDLKSTKTGLRFDSKAAHNLPIPIQFVDIGMFFEFMT